MSTPTTDTSLAPQPIDPLRDIDGRKTAMWLIFGSLGVFISLWLLAVLFNFAADEAKMQKVDRAPTVELNGLHGEEATRLGKPGASPTDAGFDKLRAAMKKYSAK